MTTFAAGVITVKKFTYRGDPNEEFSNRYHFQDDPPTSPAGWRTLVDALVGYECAGLSDLVTVVRAYCYETLPYDHPASVYTYDMAAMGTTQTGIIASSGHTPAPGDAAAWVRWKTGYSNTHGKAVYLRKYFHSILIDGSTADLYDLVLPAQKSGLESFGADLLVSGSGWPGLAAPDGSAVTDPVASTYITTRTLERRGRRPH